MNFFKKIFQSKKESTLNDSTPELEEDHIELYVNNVLSIPDRIVNEFIYQHGLNEKIIYNFLTYKHDSDFGGTGWNEKGKLNFPGPFYTGVTDTCGTGIVEAPNNIIFDENCREFVMIQPRTKIELVQLWNAGAAEVFGSYYCDGNENWTVQLVKEWWANKNEVLEHLKNSELIKMNQNQEKRYLHYLENEAKLDLRKYCYFLENGLYPNDESLPELD